MPCSLGRSARLLLLLRSSLVADSSGTFHGPGSSPAARPWSGLRMPNAAFQRSPWRGRFGRSVLPGARRGPRAAAAGPGCASSGFRDNGTMLLGPRCRHPLPPSPGARKVKSSTDINKQTSGCQLRTRCSRMFFVNWAAEKCLINHLF